MKQYRFAIIIGFFLFFIPFFWLAPGEMNLGGDSGRLYFYDPASYLNLHVFYNYLRSANGVELTYYIYLPYVVLLFLLKLIFQSPTILISFFNGLTLSVAFFSIYLILKELLKEKENEIKLKYIEFSSILAGLFYILSQLSIYSGWEKPIVAFNQLFLNPFMAFLLLKFMLTQKMRYIIIALFTTLVFTPNFSVVGAPPFFAFYPITIIFLILYAKFVRRVTFRWRFFVIGIVLFLLIHAFHLVNSVENIFSSGSSYNQAVFAQEGEENSRNGLNYFISVASNIKVSRIWMSLEQSQDKTYFAVFIIFPLVLVVSFFLNRGKTLLLTGLFFLIFLYLTSAITEAGFFVYKQFFRIPGFSMFRNFNGQWSYVFLFFYTLVLGQAIAIVANHYGKRIAVILFAIFTAVIIGFGLPFLTGSIPMPTRDTGERHVFRMDPIFEQVLQYFRSDPIDGKVLMFPLTDFGYQILQGIYGGVYKGLPMISYLGNKSEFGGYGTLDPFQNPFFASMQSNDYETLKKFISVMNIKWIFHNSDPYIYSEPFSSTYGYVSKFAPKNQEGYRAFIEKLPITKVTDFGDRYHIYSVNNDVYLPHIFATEKVNFTNNEIPLILDSNFQKDMRQVVIPVTSAIDNEDPMILYGLPKTFLTELQGNIHLHKHEPFLNRKPSDLFYPLVILREKFDLLRAKRDPNRYFNTVFLLLSKRISEMVSFGGTMSVLEKSWQKPQFWEVYKWLSSPYNSWEASLFRYEKGVEEIIDWVEKVKRSDEQQMVNRIIIKEQLYQHELVLLRAIRELNKENSEKTYLLSSVNSMYERLYGKVRIPLIDTSLYVYQLPAYTHRLGTYEVYLEKKDIRSQDPSQITIKAEDQIAKPIIENKDSSLLRFTDVKLDDKTDMDAILTIPSEDLVKKSGWSSSGIPTENADGTITMVFNNNASNPSGIGALTLEVPDWTAGNQYLISFDYNTNGNDFIFSFADKKRLDDTITKVTYKTIFEKRLNAKEFKTHQSVIFSEDETIGGFLKISPFSPNDISTIKIKNLIVRKIQYPKLMFKKIVPSNNANLAPRITFRRINPTRYAIDIKGAANPYTLVFLESFGRNWKLFNTENNTESLRGSMSRFLGRIGKFLIGPFVKDTAKSYAIAASYFDGQVKEGESKNIFIDSQTFETWGKNTVSDNSHTRANEYANAWYITPDDMGGKTDYTLILELKTQKKFYPALLVSLTTVISLIGYSGYWLGKLIWSRKQLRHF